MTKILRPGADHWALQAQLKGQECRSKIKDGESLSEVWWSALVAAHRANKVLMIEGRLVRLRRKYHHRIHIARKNSVKGLVFVAYDELSEFTEAQIKYMVDRVVESKKPFNYLEWQKGRR